MMLRTCLTSGSGPLVVCFILLSALSLCLWCVVFEYGLISRFNGVFRGFWAFRVGLCCLRALRGLCGFCVREWLGGLKACGVFAPVFHLLPISFCLSFYLFTCFLSFTLSALFWLSFACPFVLSCLFLGLCVFFFPFGLHAKRKGAKVLLFASSLGVLWVCLYV